jgi:hypothetical protein
MKDMTKPHVLTERQRTLLRGGADPYDVLFGEDGIPVIDGELAEPAGWKWVGLFKRIVCDSFVGTNEFNNEGLTRRLLDAPPNYGFAYSFPFILEYAPLKAAAKVASMADRCDDKTTERIADQINECRAEEESSALLDDLEWRDRRPLGPPRRPADDTDGGGGVQLRRIRRGLTGGDR